MLKNVNQLSTANKKKLEKLAKIIRAGELGLHKYLIELEEKVERLEAEKLHGKDGERGEKGEKGEKGDKGDKGDRGRDGRDGRDGEDGLDGRDGRDGKDGEMGIIDEATIAYLEDGIKKLETKVQESRQGRTGWGAHPITVLSEGVAIDKNVRFINFGDNTSVSRSPDGVINVNPNASGATWGSITGTLSNQSDLQTALNNKSNVGHTHITSDISGLQEYVEDTIGTKVVAGTNVTVVYNDTTGETEISAAGGGGGASVTETEIDFGTITSPFTSWVVIDAAVSSTEKILVTPSPATATGRKGNDWDLDSAVFTAIAGTGQFTVYAQSPTKILGFRKIYYQVV